MTWLMMFFRSPIIRPRASPSRPMSSSPRTSTATVRSPSEAALATFMSWLTLVSRSFLAWSIRVCWSTRSSAEETSRPTFRRASSRLSDRVIRSSVKKSMVPKTRLPRMIGKQTPDFSPLRRATGAREQLFISPRSGTKTRSRVCQAWPLSPSPSRNRASAVTRRNSSVTDPASWTNRSACSSALTSQNDPYDQPNASRTDRQCRGDHVADRAAAAQAPAATD